MKMNQSDKNFSLQALPRSRSQTQRFKSLVGQVCVALFSVALIACSGSGGSGGGGAASSTPGSSGSMAFLEPAGINAGKGDVSYVHLNLLSGSVLSEQVSLAVDDPSIATVSVPTCFLSSNQKNGNQCVVRVNALKAGTTTLRASSSALGEALIPIALGATSTCSPSTPCYGTLTAVDPNGNAITAQAFSKIGAGTTVKFVLQDAHYVPQGTVIVVPPSGSPPVTSRQITAGSQICALNIVNDGPYCYLTMTGLSQSASTIINAYTVNNVSPTNAFVPSGSGATTNTSVTLSPVSSPFQNASLSLATSSHLNNGIPVGMYAPIFISLDGSMLVNDTPIVKLEITGGSAFQFYNFNKPSTAYAGVDNVTPNLFSATDSMPNGSGGTTSIECRLSNTQKSCAYGVKALAVGSVVIKATVRGTSYLYSVNDLALTGFSATSPSVSSVRTFNFNNKNGAKALWLGVVGGTAAAYMLPDVPKSSSAATASSANTKPAGSNHCGPYNGGSDTAWSNACPVGSSCRPGGNTPNAQTDYYCYWDQPAASGGSLQIPAGGSVSASVNNYSYAPNGQQTGIYWSGNFFARIGCDSNGQNCQVANCGSPLSGSACAPGNGAASGLATLAEVTVSESPGLDYYDTSIINGVTVKTTFGPTQGTFTAPTATAPYTCGKSGASATDLGALAYSSSTYMGIGPASWSFNPNFSQTTTGSTPAPGVDAAYFRVVVPAATPQYCSPTNAQNTTNNQGQSATVCTNGDTNCIQSCPPTQVCGNSLSDFYAGPASQTGNTYAGFTGNSLVCGTQVGWLTGDAIAGNNTTNTNYSPIMRNLSASAWMNDPVPTADANINGSSVSGSGAGVGTYSNLQLCNGNTFSGYGNGAEGTNYNLACGGVIYGGVGSNAQGGVSPYANTNSAFSAANFPGSGYYAFDPATGPVPSTNGIGLTMPAGPVFKFSQYWLQTVFPSIYWLKQACPSCYTYAYDDMVSTFTCSNTNPGGSMGYTIEFKTDGLF